MDEVDGLCAVIDEEARLCGTLADVLRDEQQAVVELRPQAILACLERHRLLHDELSRLSARRRALVERVAHERGASAASATALLPLLAPDPRARLRDGVQRLRIALLEARRVERQNRLLVGAGIDTVSEILAALRGLVPSARYGADAQLAPPVSGDAISRHV